MDALSNALSHRARSGQRLALASTITNLRRDVAQAGTEATTGRVAEPAVFLGARQGTRLSLADTATRAEGIATGNALLAERMNAAQDVLGRFTDQTSNLSAALVAAVSGPAPKDATAIAARTALETMRQIANTSFAGSSLLGGERGDVGPLSSFDAATAQLEGMFDTRFGFGSDDPAAAALSADEITTFVTTIALPALQGSVWDADISNAGASASTRIAPGETISPVPTVDAEGIREGLTAALVVAHLAGSALSSEAVQATARVAVDTVGQAGADVTALRGELGLDQARVEQASERLIAQGERMRDASNAHVSVDAFEAAARFNELATQLEAAYTMTTRIHQLTLLRFLR